MRVLIVKLSSLGDVVHAMPVVHDIRQAYPGALIDWVVEPTFAPLVRGVDGVNEVIECALRRWRHAWWRGAVRDEWRDFRAKLQSVPYDAVLDLQGLTKSAVVARLANGRSHGLANRTEGSSFESPARWLVDNAIRIQPRIHALDRSRELAASALGYQIKGPPHFGLRRTAPPLSGPPTVVFAHGSSRADKLWPETSWVELGTRLSRQGWRIALPHAGDIERDRSQRIAVALGVSGDVWPEMPLGALMGRMYQTQGVIGVDSGLSHIAVALGLPHVQIYNFPTAWRTGPQLAHGHRHQVSVEARPTPSCDAVWDGWTGALRSGAA